MKLPFPFFQPSPYYIGSWNLYCAVADADTMALDDMQRDEVFNRDNIPTWLSYAGYAALSLIAVIAIPIMFREVRWYYVVVAYALAPALGFCNAYGTGLTDMNMGYNYARSRYSCWRRGRGKTVA